MSAQVIVNPDSGLAEAHDPAAASALLQRGYHLPLHDESGNAFSAPYEQASDLINSGQYRQPSPDELGQWIEHAHYNSAPQKAMAFIEGAARGLGGPIAPQLEQDVLGIPKEEQLKRKEYLPGTALTGELGSIAGLTALSSGFFGAAKGARLAQMAEELPLLPNIISKAGAAATQGMKMEGSFGRIAQAATQSAIESGLYAAQNKLTEAALGDPNALSEHMMADIGLSTLVGAGAGGAFAASGLPFKYLGNKLEKIESLVKSKIPEEMGEVGSAAPKMYGLDESAAQFKSAINLDKKSLLDKFKGLMPDLNAADVIAFARNPVGMTAYQAGKIATKLLESPEKLVDLFADQAPKVLPVLASLKTGLNTLSKVESKSAGIFGYGASEAMEKEPNSGGLHDLHDHTIKMESDPAILIQNLQKKVEPIAEHMPGTTAALSKKLSQAVQLLSMARPSLNKQAPLDMDPVPTADQKMKFNHVAHVIDNPVSVLDHVKTGSVSNDQIFVLKSMYPNLLQNMQKELTKNLMQYQADKKAPLPYPTRLSLSRLLGQPLDSTLLSISQNQAALQINSQAQAQANGLKPSKSGMGKMKFAQLDQTPAQRSQERRVGKA